MPFMQPCVVVFVPNQFKCKTLEEQTKGSLANSFLIVIKNQFCFHHDICHHPLKKFRMYQVHRFIVFSLADGQEENFVRFKGVKTFASKEDLYNHFAQKFSLSEQRPSYVKKFDEMFEDCYNKGGFIDDITANKDSDALDVLVFGKSDEMEEFTFEDYEVPMEHFEYVSGRERVECLYEYDTDDLGYYDLHKNRLLEKEVHGYTEFERDIDNLEEEEDWQKDDLVDDDDPELKVHSDLDKD
jgi:hypothetical protein